MEIERVWSIGSWVLAALAAGFIGQFGRSLALRLIDRKKAQAVRRDARRMEQGYVPNEEAARGKIDKKRAKARVKKAKKTSGPWAGHAPSSRNPPL